MKSNDDLLIYRPYCYIGLVFQSSRGSIPRDAFDVPSIPLILTVFGEWYSPLNSPYEGESGNIEWTQEYGPWVTTGMSPVVPPSPYYLSQPQGG